MKTMVLIRIPSVNGFVNGDTLIQWRRYTVAGDHCGDTHVSTFEQLGALLRGNDKENDEEDIVLFLGGVFCFYRELVVNAGQKKHLTTALPYLIEEYLAQDIDSMHIVSGQPDKNLKVSVGAISHAVLQNLLALCERCGLAISQVLPEMQFVESDNELSTLYLENESVLLARNSQNGREVAALNYDALPFIFSEHATQNTDDLVELNNSESNSDYPETIVLRFSNTELMLEPSRLEEVCTLFSHTGIQCEQKPLKHSLFDFLACQFFLTQKNHQVIDFRRGSYRCPRKKNRLLRRWWPVAALATCWLLIELGLTVTTGLVYQGKHTELWNESVQHYLKAFPNDRQASQAQKRQQLSFNIKKLLENRFKSLDTPNEISIFLPILQRVSAAVEHMETDLLLKFESLEFKQQSGQLKLELKAENLDVVNQFISAIQMASLIGTLLESKPEKDGILAMLSIREAL